MAFVFGAAAVYPEPYLRFVESVPTSRLDRACAGVTDAVVRTAVGSAKRDVCTEPDGWGWTCRWWAADEQRRQRSNPTLVVTARRVVREGPASPVQQAAKEYGSAASQQYADARFQFHVDADRAAGVAEVTVLDGVGDRAQVLLSELGVESEGYEADAVAVRGNVIVTVRYLNYAAEPRAVRLVAARAVEQAVRGV